jgi:hypothetical protein
LTNQRKVNETIKKNPAKCYCGNTRKPVDNKIAPNNKNQVKNQRIQTRKPASTEPAAVRKPIIKKMRLNNSVLVFLHLPFTCDKKVFWWIQVRWWFGTRIAWLVLTLLDSTKRYFFINIRDNNNYPYNNLFLIVSLELPNGYTKVDTLEYQMILMAHF